MWNDSFHGLIEVLAELLHVLDIVDWTDPVGLARFEEIGLCFDDAQVPSQLAVDVFHPPRGVTFALVELAGISSGSKLDDEGDVRLADAQFVLLDGWTMWIFSRPYSGGVAFASSMKSVFISCGGGPLAQTMCPTMYPAILAMA